MRSNGGQIVIYTVCLFFFVPVVSIECVESSSAMRKSWGLRKSTPRDERLCQPNHLSPVRRNSITIVRQPLKVIQNEGKVVKCRIV